MRKLIGRSRGLLLVTLALASAAGCGTTGTSGTPPPAGTQPASSGGTIPATFPLLGAWVTSITKADLVAGGVTDAGLQNENSGRFTWTFAPDGTWTQVQESLDGSPINAPVFQGTYTVDGQSIVATTTFPEQYRDSGLRYDWVLEGDAVRFDLITPPDPLLPIIVETHAWTRKA